MAIDLRERLAQERRARLAAERLLEHKSRELIAANEKLSQHARALSVQIVEQRSVVTTAQGEAEALKSQNARALVDLDRAQSSAVMAERRLWDALDTIHDDGFAVFDASRQLVAANAAFHRLFLGTADGGYNSILMLAARSGLVELDGETPAQWATRICARWDQDPIPPTVIHLTSGHYLRLVDRRARGGDIVCLALDITEQMRLWAAIEALPNGFVLFDREERLLSCNQRFRDLYAQTAPVLTTGTKFEDILRYGLSHGQQNIPEAEHDAWVATRMAQFRNPDGPIEQQLADGRWLRIIEQPTPDGGRVGLRVDISEAKAQQAALESARTAAESASRAKSAFLANMSHEIRTPMNGVVSMAELLCESPLNDDQKLFAETIKSSGEALLEIINDILDYSKIEAERLTLHPEPFDLERMIHDVVLLLQPRAKAKGVELLIDYDLFLPTRFVGDQGRLRQVMINLAGNAVKFTESGHVLIRVVGVTGDGNDCAVHITVEDTGIGIATENLDHVFGEFNQVESAQNRKFEGTGLGLAITRRLVERMGGKIWVDSALGEGSCFGFAVTLPLAEENAAPEVPAGIGRVLVIDPHFANRTLLERQLVPLGIRVTACRSGREALALLADDASPDLALIDHDPAEHDGLALVRQMRAAGVRMPVVLLLSLPAQTRAAAADLDLAAVLPKPLLRADLFRALSGLSATPAAPLSAPAVATAPTRKMRVLAAEDNRTNQLVFAKMVKDFDIEVSFANNGREAVAMFQTWSPDMIFMDVSMPEMDGRQATREIRAMEAGRAHIPIVALTAHTATEDETEILAAGMDRFLTKPLRRAAILAALTDFRPRDASPIVEEGKEVA